MPPEEVLRQFVKLRPTVIIGSTEAIALLAQDLLRRDIPERRGVRKVFPFGQTLSLQLAQMIRGGFQAEIFDFYGCIETSWIAYECEKHDGLHIPIDRVIVQISRLGEPDRPAAPGEIGEVILTSLLRKTSPFIRYRIKDVAAWDPTPCACGRALPRLRSLEGRVQDLLLSTEGRWVSPGAVATEVAYSQEAILDHRIVQETPDHIRVFIVPGASFGEIDCQRIRRVIVAHLGKVNVSIETVREIPRDPSGKRRRVYRVFNMQNLDIAR
jgi:phenylacetate-CoA ligase